MISNEANEDRYELYDLADDSGETTDLSARYPEKVKALRERLAHDTAQAVTPFNVPVAWPPPPPSGPKPLPGEKYP